MTIDQMRTLTGLSIGATDAEVVAAYAALIDDGIPASIVLVEPVTVEMARKQCRLDDDEEDDVIAQKITSAREWVEDYTGRVIAQQTLVEHYRSWGSYLEIVRRPIISIDAVAYNGLDGDATYVDGAYSIGAYPLRIAPGDDGFPALRPGGSITVAFTAGYDVDEVPKRVVEAILVIVDGMMSQRDGAYATSLKAAESLLARMSVPVL